MQMELTNIMNRLKEAAPRIDFDTCLALEILPVNGLHNATGQPPRTMREVYPPFV